MPFHGSPLNGGTGPTYGSAPQTGQAQLAVVEGKVKERIHALAYSATEGKLLLDVDTEQDKDTVKTDTVGELSIQNTGGTPAYAILAYRLWTTATAMSGNTYHLNYLLRPGESLYVPDTMAVIADETVEQLTGTVVDNVAPDSNEYTDSTAATTEGFADDDDTTIGFDDASGGGAGNMFKVNELIRLDNEVCRIKSIVDTAGDGDYTPANFIVERAVHGTAKADHTNNTAIRFPFFNAYHDFDKYTVAQTDSNGKFKSFNFFGQGRATTGLHGLTPGSTAIKFYEAGYQSLGLSGITSSADTKLTASGSYWFKIAIDGGTAEAINFTVDSSNTNWGGTNGVLSKIQTALDDKYNNTASNTFQQDSRIDIIDGDIRFTSGQRLSTSAIALTAGTDGASASYNIFAQPNGWFPALANIRDAVAARLPDDVVYDRITYTTSPNTGAFMYDDGYGRLFGMGTGTINYETGAIDFTGPSNAEFVVSCLHSSAFSGKKDATDTVKMNSLKAIYGNVPNQKWNGELTIMRK